MGALTQVLVESATNNAPIAFYIYGVGLAERITPGGQVSTYHFNLQGSTVALTDSGGNVTDTYAFDSFGVLANLDGDSPQPFRYLGRYGIIDDSTGLLYARARYFSPQLGRFITKDPITGRDSDAQSLNRYVYALNCPLSLHDVNGLCASQPQTYSGATDANHVGLLMTERERRIYILRLKAQVAQQNYIYALEAQDAYYQAAINYFSALSTIGEVAGYAADVLSLGGTAITRNAITQTAANTAGRGYRSFSAFKRVEGIAGENQAWHHIVEQTPSNVERFGAINIHNSENLVKLPHGPGTVHNQISAYYSSKQWFSGEQTVRQWLSSQSFEEQATFGRDILQTFSAAP
jgi:RHS repeat-associated protein